MLVFRILYLFPPGTIFYIVEPLKAFGDFYFFIFFFAIDIYGLCLIWTNYDAPLNLSVNFDLIVLLTQKKLIVNNSS